jgi:formamidopyrimidine-DNA glycosylase
MPEGPEILYFCVLLSKKIRGWRFVEIKFNTNKKSEIPEDIEGEIEEIGCKGKLLWMVLSSKEKNKKYYMHIHFGISGWIEFVRPEKNIKYEIRVERGGEEIELYMEDMRRFSKIKIVDEEEHDRIIGELGASIFTEEFSEEYFRKMIKSRKTYVASLIMEQKMIAGIGNYIKNEAIYMSKLGGRVKSDELEEEEIRELYKNIKYVAYSSLMEQLKSKRLEREYKERYERYEKNRPEKIEIPYRYRIYGREKTDDGKRVKKIKVAGRDSYVVE